MTDLTSLGPERRAGVERRVADIGPAVLGEPDRRSGRERRRYNVDDLDERWEQLIE